MHLNLILWRKDSERNKVSDLLNGMLRNKSSDISTHTHLLPDGQGIQYKLFRHSFISRQPKTCVRQLCVLSYKFILSEQEQDAAIERMRKERENKQKQDVMTLEETKEQVSLLTIMNRLPYNSEISNDTAYIESASGYASWII